MNLQVVSLLLALTASPTPSLAASAVLLPPPESPRGASTLNPDIAPPSQGIQQSAASPTTSVEGASAASTEQPSGTPLGAPSSGPSPEPGAPPPNTPSAPATPATPALPASPAAPSPANAGATADPAPATAQADHQIDLGGACLVPHIGLLAFGSGTLRRSCDGGGCDPNLEGASGFRHNQSLQLGVDFLWQLTSWLRIGPGVLYTVEGDIDPASSGEQTFGLGPIASLDAVAELSIGIADRVWLVPRVQGGLSVLTPVDELEDHIREVRQRCQEDDSLKDCDSLDGTRFGANLGVGAAGLFAISESVRLRLDAILEWYYLRIYSVHDSARAQDLTLHANGVRGMLLGGMEF